MGKKIPARSGSPGPPTGFGVKNRQKCLGKKVTEGVFTYFSIIFNGF
jgi:hypothetical protein